MANDAKFSWAMNNSYEIQEYQVEESSALNSGDESWFFFFFSQELKQATKFFWVLLGFWNSLLVTHLYNLIIIHSWNNYLLFNLLIHSGNIYVVASFILINVWQLYESFTTDYKL